MEATNAIVKWHFTLVKLDDIVIFSMTLQKYNDLVKQVRTLMHCADVTLKLNKCPFFTYTTNHLGHVFRPSRLEIAAVTAEAIPN